MTAPLAAINDFVVKFANVNGSGSASANSMFAKAVLRMGVPVAVRNIFPSNIQGLPTWFEVRVTGEGHLGRRGGVDMMVAMNPQTWDRDVAEIEPGGYLFYDSTKPMPPSKFRPDINVSPLYRKLPPKSLRTIAGKKIFSTNLNARFITRGDIESLHADGIKVFEPEADRVNFTVALGALWILLMLGDALWGRELFV
jgi:Pyruvate/2-oxoacid:ferredoxin oxidoreductase gamma subunit